MERLGYSKDYINAVKSTIDVRDLYERTLAAGPAVSSLQLMAALLTSKGRTMLRSAAASRLPCALAELVFPFIGV